MNEFSMGNKGLRFSVPDWCAFPAGANPEDYYGALSAIGYEAAEMVPPERRAAARAAGLSILNIAAPGMGGGLNDRAMHADIIACIRTTIIEAAKDDIAHVIIFSGNRTPGIDDGPAACAEAIEQVLPDAEKAGRVLTFEMLNSYDHGGYEADYSPYGFDLAKHFDSPHLKVLLDLYHMHRMGEDPVTLIRDNLRHIAHLHVAGSPSRDFPGAGQQINYASCIQTATDVGYKGFWGMEFSPGEDRMLALAQAVKHFQGLAPAER
ncbi:MAG: TIM barrel protein [Verrucomicrobia bacterium]|nr:TIM barrel protein [Verrucomicrobiota bacterium]